MIAFDLPGDAEVDLRIYDVAGRLGRTALERVAPHFTVWETPPPEVVDAARWLGFDPIFVQEEGCEELGVPDWEEPEVFRWEDRSG